MDKSIVCGFLGHPVVSIRPTARNCGKIASFTQYSHIIQSHAVGLWEFVTWVDLHVFPKLILETCR